MRKFSFIFFLLFSFSSIGKTPGKVFKDYIKSLQSQKALKETVKIGDGIFLNLSNPSEKFILQQMDVKVLKEVVVENRAEVFFLITWPVKPLAIENFLKKEENNNLKNEIPNEYIELKKIGKKRVINIGTISVLKGKAIFYKNEGKWSQFIKTKNKQNTVIKSYCITHHIHEAMELNEKRKKFYSALTNGRSRILSNFLIASEKMSLFAVKMMELQALPFNKLGVDILCKEMISMKKAPAFQSKKPLKKFPKMKRFKKWNSKNLVKDLYKTYKKRDFKVLSTVLRKELEKLKMFPGMYCMHRHIVESILRTANYGPIHKEKAKSLGLNTKNVEKLGEISWNFILSQIITFPLAHQIDKMAYPFQQEGIPIICQDVPHIPEY